MTADTASIPAPGDTVAVRTHDDGARGTRGVIARVDEHAVVLRLEGERPMPGVPVLVAPSDIETGFRPIPCVVADGQPEDRNIVVLQIQRRDTFRVRLPAGACVAELPDGTRTDVLNMSEEGIAFQISGAPEDLGENVSITLSDRESEVRGSFVVRNQREVRTGAIVGLEVSKASDAARAWMRDRVVEHQRTQLASASAVGPPAPEAVAGPPPKTAPGSPGTTDPEEAPEAPKPSSRARRAADRRQHPRTPYKSNGMAYIMESKDDRRSPVETIDISRSGVAMRAPFAMEKGRRVMVVLDRETGAPWVLGRVVHCAPAPDSGAGFRIGVQFIQSAMQDWPAPDPASLLRVAADLERTAPRGRKRPKRSGLSISFG